MSEPNLDRWAREVAEQSKGRISAGLGLTLVLHLLAQVPVFFLLFLISQGNLILAFLPVMYIGLSQLVYMIPAVLIFRRRGDTENAKGLIVGASITFLLNATCHGLLFYNP